ncbi:hypothetical protein AB0E08_29850 [Streptomyces sp. NPDC048281]|uniref:hypothetical protein n=1 Tax=Streptomyces sp. NPDC048281 TaxID=3154715 RepID=UPI003430852D
MAAGAGLVAGPSDPRTASVLEPVKATMALDAEDLAEMAAVALAPASGGGDGGCAKVLHHLVAVVPAVRAALKLPELGAFYLAEAAVFADRLGALRATALAEAVTAAFEVRRRLDETTLTAAPTTSSSCAAAAGGRCDAVSFADQALFDVRTLVWRTDTALPNDQESVVLAHLQALAAPLARPAPDQDIPVGAPGPAAGGQGEPMVWLGSNLAVRALGCPWSSTPSPGPHPRG